MDNNYLLLVEDDKNLQASNKRILERRGYKVRQATTLAEARMIIGEEAPGAIVLDVMLPDGNGLDFLRQLRKTSNVPVLVLTAMDTNDDVFAGINAGGDIYLTKPYDNNVFLAHIDSLLRRAGRVPKVITKGSLVLDIVSGKAFINKEGQNNDLLLTQKEFACLFLFVQNEAEVMSADFVYESVWKQPLEDNINTFQKIISNLRKKIEDSGYTINVTRGEGYVLEKS